MITGAVLSVVQVYTTILAAEVLLHASVAVTVNVRVTEQELVVST